MTHVYLRHENAAGFGDGVELYPGRSYFLPNDGPNIRVIDVVEEMDGTHSGTKLALLIVFARIYEEDVLISAYGSNRTIVLEEGGIGRYKVPISLINDTRQIFIVLRRGDQILTPSGRWSLVWRTGESQMSVPPQGMRSDAIRSFDASLEVENSKSQADEGSITHDAVDGFIVESDDDEEEEEEDGPHVLASILMPPPPLPVADVLLSSSDPPEEVEDTEDSMEVDVNKRLSASEAQEKPEPAGDTQPLSQGKRKILSEISSNPVMILTRSKGNVLPRSPKFLSDRPEIDENEDMQCPDSAITDVNFLIEDIAARRIPQSNEERGHADVSPEHMSTEEQDDLSKHVDIHEEYGPIRLIHIGASVSIEPLESADSTAAVDAELLKTVLGTSLETVNITHIDVKTVIQPRPSSSTPDIQPRAEIAQGTGDDPAFAFSEIRMDSSDTVPAEKLMATAEEEITMPSSASPKKRKMPSYSRREMSTNKRHRSEESHSAQAANTVILEPRTRLTKEISTTDNVQSPDPRRTSRTPKSTPQVSSSTSSRSRTGRKSQKVSFDTTPSRSRSTSTASSTHFDQCLGSPPRVLFTSTTTVDTKRDTMNDFVKLGGEKVDNIDRANMLIVGGTEIKKTAKLIIAVARGMDVVNERWIVESRRKDKLLDIISFLPDDAVHEREWGTTIVEATARGKEGVIQELLHDTTVHTTKDLNKGVVARDLPSVVKALGGSIVKGSLPSGKSRTKNVLILGTREDPQAFEVQKMGHKLFDKDVVILGALRGKIDLESSEFEIVLVKEEESQ